MIEEKEELSVEAKQRIEDYKFVFSSEEGKRVLEDMGLTYNGPTLFSENGLSMAYLVGQRDVYFDILAMVEYKEKPLKKEEVES